MGLKQVTGINRVTLKTSKNSYVIFGECKMFDYSQDLAANKAAAFQKPEEATTKTTTGPETTKPEVKVDEDAEEDGDEDAGDIAEESINTLMEYANCSRAKAIKGLKKTGGDVVEAITLVS